MNRIQQFVFVDARARRICYAISFSAAFLYAIISQFVFGRKEADVTNEALGICFGLLLASLLSYRFWPRNQRWIAKKEIQPRVSKGQVVLFFVAWSILCFAPLVRSDRIQASVVDARLSIASFFVERVFASNSSEDRVVKQLDKIQNAMYVRAKHGIDADPLITEKLQRQIATGMREKPLSESTKRKAWSALVALDTFNKFGNEQLQTFPVKGSMSSDELMDRLGHLNLTLGLRIYGDPPGSAVLLPGDGEMGLLWASASPLVVEDLHVVGRTTNSAFLMLWRNETRALVRNSKIENVMQTLDGTIWDNVEFVNSFITTYSAGAIYLKNVTFTNCKFFFPNPHNSSDLDQLIKQAGSSSVTYANPGEQ
jgi:hypothetical protein